MLSIVEQIADCELGRSTARRRTVSLMTAPLRQQSAARSRFPPLSLLLPVARELKETPANRMTPTIFCDRAKKEFEGVANVEIFARELGELSLGTNSKARVSDLGADRKSVV